MNDAPAETSAETGAAAKDAPRLELSASRGFESWLTSAGVSLAFTTYQAGKMFLLGV